MHSQDSLFSCVEMSKRPIKEEEQGGEPAVEKKLCTGFDKFGVKPLYFNFHFGVCMVNC